MRTSFTTKFLDYVAFGKPVILSGPAYCTPFRVAQKHGGAFMVNQEAADAVVSACCQLAGNTNSTGTTFARGDMVAPERV